MAFFSVRSSYILLAFYTVVIKIISKVIPIFLPFSKKGQKVIHDSNLTVICPRTLHHELRSFSGLKPSRLKSKDKVVLGLDNGAICRDLRSRSINIHDKQEKNPSGKPEGAHFTGIFTGVISTYTRNTYNL